MDFRYSKTMRTISCIVLFFFIWTFGVYDIAFAFQGEQQFASNSNQSWKTSKQLPSGSQSRKKPDKITDKKSGKKFVEALNTLEQILLDPNTDTITKKNKAKAKKAEIEALDIDIKKLFSEIEKTLKDKGLPYEILDRHYSFINLYEDNLKELKKYFKAIEKAKNKAEADDAFDKTREFLKKVKPPKKHTPVDPEILPFRTQEPAFIEPRTNPDEFLTEQVARWDISKKEPILIVSVGSLNGLLTSSSDLNSPLPYVGEGLGEGAFLLAQADPPTSADLAETIEVKFTPAIQAKATELGYHPVKIYNWVRNNIEFAPTYGSIQGADMCLKTKQCNDIDTASLLIALLRASDIPARYVYGTVEIPIEKVMNWVGGFTDPMAALMLIAAGGIPVAAVKSGGTVRAVRMEHMWVEAWIDYIPSQGATHKTGQGDTWIRLDASFKQNTYTQGIDIQSTVPFDEQSFEDQIIATATYNEAEGYATGVDCLSVGQTMSDYETDIKNYLDQDHPEATMGKVIGKKEIVQEDYPYLLGTLPYRTIATGQKTSEVHDSLRHRITFKLTKGSSDEIVIEKALPEIAGKKITLSYIPAEQADADVINSYLAYSSGDWAGLPESLPAYLINVKPELRIDGEVVDAGTKIGLGRTEGFSTTFTGPNQATEIVPRGVTAGDYLGIAIDTGRISESEMTALRERIDVTRDRLAQSDFAGLTKDGVLGDSLYTTALTYFAEVDRMNHIRSEVLDVVSYRLPSESIYSASLNIAFVLGVPLSAHPRGLTMEILRDINNTQSRSGNKDKRLQFSFISGMDSSSLMHAVTGDLFSPPDEATKGMSAVRVLAAAKDQGVPVYTIDQTNVNAVIPQLEIDPVVITDIQNAVNAGNKVIVNKANITLDGWTGCGYAVIDPQTADSAYTIYGVGIPEVLPWMGHSVISNIANDITLSQQELLINYVSEIYAGKLGNITAGISDISSTMATNYLDLIASSYLQEILSGQLGCYINLSTPSSSLGACMSLFLGALCVAMDTSAISTGNNRPVANAGGDQTVAPGEVVILDGSGSYDIDGDTLTYQWSFVSVPEGSSSTLSSTTSVMPSFVAAQYGTYVVQLVVHDGTTFSIPSSATINVNMDLVVVPDIVGLPQQEAESQLLSAGLSIGSITEGGSPTIPAGRIISQDPASGTRVNKGSAVNIVVSSGIVEDILLPELSVSFNNDPPLYNPGDIVIVTIIATDDAGSPSVTMTLDGVDTPVTLPTTSIDTTGYALGSNHVIVVTATDSSSNERTVTAVFGIRNPGDVTEPGAAITSPPTDSEITEPTEITGTASDESLLEYTLAYSPVGKNTFTTFALGTTSVTDGVLGTIDPTLMENGIYDIRLTVTDTNGVSIYTETTYRVTGDMKVGNFTVAFTDVNVPVSGIPVTVTRMYDSRDKESHDFGFGWTIDIQNVKIEENALPGTGWVQNSYGSGLSLIYCLEPPGEHYVAITLPDGKVEESDMVLGGASPDPDIPSNCSRLVPWEYLTITVSYDARPGTTSELTLKTTPVFYYTGGTLLDMDTGEPFNPSAYILTALDGTQYELDQNFGIKKIIDPDGNTLTYASNGITHSDGKGVAFTRDTENRITTITDPNGGIITYEYDERGDLVSVTDQEGNVSQYTYNRFHGLTDIKDPRGITPLRNIYDDSGRLIAHIDAYGNKIEYTHDIDGRQEFVRDRNGNQTLYVYDDKGRVLSKTDPLGHTTTYTYDANGNKLSETDPLGNTTTWTYDDKNNMLSETRTLEGQPVTTSYTYNALGKVLTTTDPMNNVTTNTYDLGGKLLTTTDPLDNTTTYTYSLEKGLLLTTTDALDNTTSYQYNYYGDRIKETGPLGVTSYTYDMNGNKKTETDPNGGVTKYTYDSLNRQISVEDPLGHITRTEYDSSGNVSARVDALGIRTTYVYNSANKLVQTNYPDGTTTQVGYDAEGNRISSTDQLGRVTTYTYDVNKQLTQITYPDTTTQGYGYDNAGRQTTVTDALGNTTTSVYDSLGRVIENIDPMTYTTSYGYDLNGNQTSQTDANENTTTFVYDANNRQTQTILAGGQTTTVAYDELGRKISETDAANKITQFGYDANGNLTSVTDAHNNVTQYEYDGNGNRTKIIDARVNSTTFTYDLANRLTSKTMPNGGIEKYTYDASGRQIAKTDAMNRKIQYAYDSMGRMISRTYPDNKTVSLTYNLTGRRATAIDTRGITSYTYDNRDRLTQMLYPDGQAIDYTYDQRGQVETISSLAGTMTYNYNCCRLESVTDPNGNVTTFAYDPAGNRTGLNYPNGTSVTYTYDINNRLTNLEHKNSVSEILSSYAYTLGPIGNRTQIDESNGIVRQYTYDDLYRLTKDQVTDPNNTQTYQTDYTYDAVGNRLTKVHDSVSTDYTYNNADQLITENGIIYTHDLNGNLTSKSDASGTATYGYDYDNRLVEVVTASETTTYAYDVDGNRIEKTISSGTLKYLVDTNRGLSQVLAEYEPDETLIASYVYADDLISMTRNGQTYYYHFDGLGSTQLLTDSTGNVTDTYDYDAFGNLINRTGTTDNPFLFTGQQYDANIGFYYLRARYYQPGNGRFISFDPFAGNSYDPISLHKYLYAAADPVNKIDPSGETTVAIGVLLVGLVSFIMLAQIYQATQITSFSLSRVDPPLRLYRYMSRDSIEKSWKRGIIHSKYGITWWTPDSYVTAEDAKNYLSLKYKPDGWVSLLIWKFRDLMIGPLDVDAKPEFGTTGGGQQYLTFKPIVFYGRQPSWGFFQ